MDFPKALERFIGTGGVTDRSGHSPAKVYETSAGFFIKCDEPGMLERERRMTGLFHALGLGAEAVGYFTLERDYLVTRRVPGEDLTKDLSDPMRTCRLLAHALRTLHGRKIPEDDTVPVSSRFTRFLEAAQGPSDGGEYDPSVYTGTYRLASKQDAWQVMQEGKHLLKCDSLIHGDACLPNVMQLDGAFSGFIDVAMGGMGDRHMDLYWALWSLEYNFKTDRYNGAFLDLYGRERVSEEMFGIIAAFEAFG
ncbi:MAG: phosphotransferase [Clostridiales bacterium]|nr:phosphotransferase [Clostridiales bacterium]